MRLGVVFPQTEIGADPIAVRDFAQAAEQLGYDHIAAFDHVIGANAESRPAFRGLYTHESLFHEPFVLFGYLAGVTSSIELVTGILILPQRQTVLVAKQAAALDVLSGGRLRLGIGIGWNDVEYQSLGENFGNRGRRSEEQIAVLRALWTRELVTFDGEWHQIVDAGLNPMPVQQPIPIWFGGMAEAVVERVARLGDGWFPRFPALGHRASDEVLPRRADAPTAIIARLHDYARSAGRRPEEIGIEGRINFGAGTPAAWLEEYDAWTALGAGHMQVFTMRCGLTSPDQHIAAIRDVKTALDNR